jgi:hypothetical protein
MNCLQAAHVEFEVEVHGEFEVSYEVESDINEENNTWKSILLPLANKECFQT